MASGRSRASWRSEGLVEKQTIVYNHVSRQVSIAEHRNRKHARCFSSCATRCRLLGGGGAAGWRRPTPLTSRPHWALRSDDTRSAQSAIVCKVSREKLPGCSSLRAHVPRGRATAAITFSPAALGCTLRTCLITRPDRQTCDITTAVPSRPQETNRAPTLKRGRETQSHDRASPWRPCLAPTAVRHPNAARPAQNSAPLRPGGAAQPAGTGRRQPPPGFGSAWLAPIEGQQGRNRVISSRHWKEVDWGAQPPPLSSGRFCDRRPPSEESSECPLPSRPPLALYHTRSLARYQEGTVFA